MPLHYATVTYVRLTRWYCIFLSIQNKFLAGRFLGERPAFVRGYVQVYVPGDLNAQRSSIFPLPSAKGLMHACICASCDGLHAKLCGANAVPCRVVSQTPPSTLSAWVTGAQSCPEQQSLGYHEWALTVTGVAIIMPAKNKIFRIWCLLWGLGNMLRPFNPIPILGNMQITLLSMSIFERCLTLS